MPIDHEMHRARVKQYAFKSGHDIVYNDGGAEPAMSPQGLTREDVRTRKLDVIPTDRERLVGKK